MMRFQAWAGRALKAPAARPTATMAIAMGRNDIPRLLVERSARLAGTSRACVRECWRRLRGHGPAGKLAGNLAGGNSHGREAGERLCLASDGPACADQFLFASRNDRTVCAVWPPLGRVGAA